VALLGFADSFIRSGKGGILPAIKCLRAIFQLSPPLPPFLLARTHLQLGVILRRDTKNQDLAKQHFEQAVSNIKLKVTIFKKILKIKFEKFRSFLLTATQHLCFVVFDKK
jgi:hypothetical protein